jgi:hypothetical protein
MNPVLICVFALIVIARFRRDFESGLASTVFFLVLLPRELQIETSEALPQISAHRVILVIAAFEVLRLRGVDPLARVAVPGVGLLIIAAVARTFSTVLAPDFGPAFKELLSFIIEVLLFFTVIASGLRNADAARRVLRAALWGLLIVSMIAIVEKYRGINLAKMLIPSVLDHWNTVSATFRHRILLGYAMAMGFGLAIAMQTLATSRAQRIAATAAMLMLPAACYFSNSRGPWAGLAIGGIMIALTGDKLIRRRLTLIGLVALAVLLIRPGVRDTIFDRWAHTVDEETHKGRSASYRKELWKVAYNQLSKSPERFLFGFGGQSTQKMDLGEEFEFGGSASGLGYTSWDSEYAANFMHYGSVGLVADTLMYLGILGICLLSWKRASRENRVLLGGCLSIMAVYLWAMSNVAIFNPQLVFLFWTAVAIGVRAPAFGPSPSDEIRMIAGDGEDPSSSAIYPERAPEAPVRPDGQQLHIQK